MGSVHILCVKGRNSNSFKFVNCLYTFYNWGCTISLVKADFLKIVWNQNVFFLHSYLNFSASLCYFQICQILRVCMLILTFQGNMPPRSAIQLGISYLREGGDRMKFHVFGHYIKYFLLQLERKPQSASRSVFWPTQGQSSA